MSSRSVAIVAFDKFTDIDVFLAWDLFNRVRFRDKELTVKIVGSKKEHISVCGLPIQTHDNLSVCSSADIVFFASGPGTRQFIKDTEVLSQFHLDTDRQIICSICSGALILAKLGLLDGLTATTYPTAIDELKSLGVNVVEKPLVTHGNIATAAGCMAAIDLVGWTIEKLWGTDVKDHILASVQPVGKGLECIY